MSPFFLFFLSVCRNNSSLVSLLCTVLSPSPHYSILLSFFVMTFSFAHVVSAFLGLAF